MRNVQVALLIVIAFASISKTNAVVIDTTEEPFFSRPPGSYVWLSNEIEGTKFLGKEAIVHGRSSEPVNAIVDSIVASYSAFNPAGRPIRSSVVTSRYPNGSVKHQSVLLGSNKKVVMGVASFDAGEVISSWTPKEYTGTHLSPIFINNTKARELQWRAENSSNVLTGRIYGHYQGLYKEFSFHLSAGNSYTAKLHPAPNENQWVVMIKEFNSSKSGLVTYHCLLDFNDNWQITDYSCPYKMLIQADATIRPGMNSALASVVGSLNIMEHIRFAPRVPELSGMAIHSPIILSIPKEIQGELWLRGLPKSGVSSMILYSTDGILTDHLDQLY